MTKKRFYSIITIVAIAILSVGFFSACEENDLVKDNNLILKAVSPGQDVQLGVRGIFYDNGGQDFGCVKAEKVNCIEVIVIAEAADLLRDFNNAIEIDLYHTLEFIERNKTDLEAIFEPIDLDKVLEKEYNVYCQERPEKLLFEFINAEGEIVKSYPISF